MRGRRRGAAGAADSARHCPPHTPLTPSPLLSSKPPLQYVLPVYNTRELSEAFLSFFACDRSLLIDFEKLRLVSTSSWAGLSNMALLRPADDPPARRGRRGDPAPAGPPAVGEPPPPSRHAHGGPRSPDDATSAPWSAVTAELARCADKFGLLSKPFQDSDQVSEGEAVAMLQACGFSAQDCTEIVRDMVAASPDHCTPSTMPTPISLFAESDKCGASGAHCAPTNDTAPMGMSSPLLPCSADTPGTALTPGLQLAFAEMSTMDMADRSAATTPVADDLGAACTTLPMPAVSAAHHSLLPPGPPLLHPDTSCVPLGSAGLAASKNLGMVDSNL